MATQNFKEYIDASFPEGGKRTRSAVIHREYAERIVRFLKATSADEDKHFRHLQSTLRRPEVHTFHRKIGIYTALMGVNDMRAAHVVVKNNTKYKTL